MTTRSDRQRRFLDRIIFVVFLIILSFAAAKTSSAQSFEDRLIEIEQRWLYANYELAGKEQKKALAELLDDAREFAATHQDRADALAWHGIVASANVDLRGRLGKNRVAREARDALHRAEATDPMILDELIYAHLGALYSKVPGGIAGFGNENTAIGYLWKAVAVNPDGFDSNFMYAKFLLKNKNYQAARAALLRARSEPEHRVSGLADRGRQRAVSKLLSQIDQLLESST